MRFSAQFADDEVDSSCHFVIICWQGRWVALERRKPSRTAGNRNPTRMGWPPWKALPGVPREVTPVEIPLAAERPVGVGLRAMGR